MYVLIKSPRMVTILIRVLSGNFLLGGYYYYLLVRNMVWWIFINFIYIIYVQCTYVCICNSFYYGGVTLRIEHLSWYEEGGAGGQPLHWKLATTSKYIYVRLMCWIGVRKFTSKRVLLDLACFLIGSLILHLTKILTVLGQ